MPRRWQLLLFFSAAIVLSRLAALPAKVCPPCGGVAVPYPLSTGADCGDPRYKIRCDGSSLFFSSANQSSYPVLSIAAETQRLIIGPSPLVSGSCTTQDLPTAGLHLDPSLPFNITQSNTIFYLNCTDRILSSPLNCSSNSPCHVYANLTAEGRACGGAQICCTFGAGGSSTSYSLRATLTGCSAYRSFVGLDTGSTPPTQWEKKSGVEIQWASPREPICRTQEDCSDGGNAVCRRDKEGTAAVNRCFCVSGHRWDPFTGFCVNNATGCELAGNCGNSRRHHLIAGLLSGFAAVILVGTAAFWLLKKQRRRKLAREKLMKEREEILNAHSSNGRRARNFTGREIKKATGNFCRSNFLGAGGFGEVFKGTLEDGVAVAVKCAKLGNTKSTEQVLNEVRVLSQVNHRSLVKLLGCCVDLDQPLMVYEFIPNGTLYDHLHGDRAALPWRRRLNIALQTAEGLAYLHSAAVPAIYHRDVKSSNILLDEKLNAKVSDFGLSRLAEADLSHISTCAQGTLGYLDPEYYRNYQLTDKSDVYSFGVVLLELLTAQKAIDFCRDPEDVNLAVFVRRKVEEEKVMEVVDKALLKGASQLSVDTMKAFGFLAVGCLEERRQNRPSMTEVAEEIAYLISIEAGDVELYAGEDVVLDSGRR